MRDYLTDWDLADELGIPERTPAQWRYLGRGPAFIKVGRHVRYRRVDVDQWIASNRHQPAGAAS